MNEQEAQQFSANVAAIEARFATLLSEYRENRRPIRVDAAIHLLGVFAHARGIDLGLTTDNPTPAHEKVMASRRRRAARLAVLWGEALEQAFADRDGGDVFNEEDDE